MNSYAEKIDIIQWIDSISATERESIQRGMDDSANGKVTSHTEIRKKYEKWL